MSWIAFLAVFGVLQTYREPPMGDAGIPERTLGADDVAAAAGVLEGAWALLWSGSAAEAEALAERGLAALPETEETAVLRVRLLELVAWARLDGGDDARARDALRRVPAGEKVSELLVARLELARTGGEPALRHLEEAFREAPSDHAAMVVAMAHLDAGHPENVVAMMRQADARVGGLAHTRIDAALFYAGHFAASFEIAELGWGRFRDPLFAYNAACSLSRMGSIDEGLAWLGTAIDGGFADGDFIDRDEDIAALRADPRFAALRARVGIARPQTPSQPLLPRLVPVLIIAAVVLALVTVALWPKARSAPPPPESRWRSAQTGDGTNHAFTPLPLATRPEDKLVAERLDGEYSDIGLEGPFPVAFYALGCDGTRCEVGLRVYAHGKGTAGGLPPALKGTDFEASAVDHGTSAECMPEEYPTALTDCHWVDVRCGFPAIGDAKTFLKVRGREALSACAIAMVEAIEKAP